MVSEKEGMIQLLQHGQTLTKILRYAVIIPSLLLIATATPLNILLGTSMLFAGGIITILTEQFMKRAEDYIGQNTKDEQELRKEAIKELVEEESDQIDVTQEHTYEVYREPFTGRICEKRKAYAKDIYMEMSEEAEWEFVNGKAKIKNTGTPTRTERVTDQPFNMSKTRLR